MDRLLKIREKLAQKELDGVLITDEKNQRYATGFAFTDGAVLIARERAFLFTDSQSLLEKDSLLAFTRGFVM